MVRNGAPKKLQGVVVLAKAPVKLVKKEQAV